MHLIISKNIIVQQYTLLLLFCRVRNGCLVKKSQQYSISMHTIQLFCDCLHPYDNIILNYVTRNKQNKIIIVHNMIRFERKTEITKRYFITIRNTHVTHIYNIYKCKCMSKSYPICVYSWCSSCVVLCYFYYNNNILYYNNTR